MPVPVDTRERTAVYRLYDVDGRLLYVGITNDVVVRWRAHASQKAWWPQVAEKHVEWHATRPAAREAELLAIRTEAPVHNVESSPTYVRPLGERGTPIADFRARLSHHVNRVLNDGEVVWLTSHGRRVAAAIPAEWAEKMLAERAAGSDGHDAPPVRS